MTTTAANESCERIIQTAGYPKRGFTEEEAAFYLGLSRSFLRQSRMDGIRQNRTPGPPFLKIGRAVRYLKEDLDGWLECFRKQPANGEES
jgi:excisionase family DNA binding protein